MTDVSDKYAKRIVAGLRRADEFGVDRLTRFGCWAEMDMELTAYGIDSEDVFAALFIVSCFYRKPCMVLADAILNYGMFRKDVYDADFMLLVCDVFGSKRTDVYANTYSAMFRDFTFEALRTKVRLTMSNDVSLVGFRSFVFNTLFAALTSKYPYLCAKTYAKYSAYMERGIPDILGLMDKFYALFRLEHLGGPGSRIADAYFAARRESNMTRKFVN